MKNDEIEVVIEASLVYNYRQIKKIPRCDYDSIIRELDHRDSAQAQIYEHSIARCHLNFKETVGEPELEYVMITPTVERAEI